jgi:hypothetical protein
MYRQRPILTVWRTRRPDWRANPTSNHGGTVNKTIGIILIVLGLVGLAYGGFHYTTRQRVMDIGPIHASREKTHNVPLPPIAGAAALIGGIVLLIVPSKG